MVRVPTATTMNQPRCSMCRRAVDDPKLLPFCSPRCQQQDLVNWLDGAYSLEGPPPDDVDVRPSPPDDDES